MRQAIIVGVDGKKRVKCEESEDESDMKVKTSRFDCRFKVKRFSRRTLSSLISSSH